MTCKSGTKRIREKKIAGYLLLLLLVVFIVGALIPGAWRNTLEKVVGASSSLASLAHCAFFAGMAALLVARPLAWPRTRAVLLLLILALLTEGLQFFTIDRQPDWMDVGFDMTGALGGILANFVVARFWRKGCMAWF